MLTKAVVAALIVEQGKILIARRAKGETHAFKWEFPGGKLESGETPEQGLVREIKEELGLDILVDKFCASNKFEYKDFTIELSAYWAKCVNQKQPSLSVHDEIRFVTPAQLVQFDLTPADIPIMVKAVSVMNKSAAK